MRFRSLAYRLAVGSVFYYAQVGNPLAQSASPPIKKALSNGLIVSISKVVYNPRDILIQFVATNGSASRIYIQDAWSDQSQRAFLKSGENLRWPVVSGINQCSFPLDLCLRNGAARDLSKFSYIEPGGVMAFSFKYQLASKISEDDSISFAVALMARIAPLKGDQDEAGSAKSLRFNFPDTSESPH